MRAGLGWSAAFAAPVVVGMMAAAAWAQDAVGEWHGALKLPSATLRVGVIVKAKTSGGYEGVLTSPDQTPNPFPMDEVKVEGGVLSFSVSALRATYLGRWDADKQAWVGELHQGAADLPLVLTPGKPEAPAAASPQADSPPLPLYATPHLVSLPRGRRLNLVCMGQGSPTVILEDALGGSGWPLLQYKIARTTRTCSYSRAGMGFSDEGPAPRDATAVTADLAALLKASGEKGPYVLVGHSLASYFVRLYADLHPKDVVGMVLVDPSIDDQLPRMAAVAPHLAKDGLDLGMPAKCAAAAEAGELKPGTDVYKPCSPAPERGWPSLYRTLKSEAESMDRDSAEVKSHRRSYGDMPLVVLTASKIVDPAMSDAENQAWAKLWMKAHDDMAALASHGQNRVVEGASHMIELEKPQVVIDTVNEVVAEARKAFRHP